MTPPPLPPPSSPLSDYTIYIIDLRDLSVDSQEQAATVLGGGGTLIRELLREGCGLVLLLVQCKLPIPHIWHLGGG
jgi:hypothetical protein